MASHGVPRVSAAVPSEQSRQKELKKIEQYQQLVETVQSKFQAHEYTAETLALTSKLLNENPEYYTVWNYRRRLLQDVFEKELAKGATGEERDDVADQRARGPLSSAQHEISSLIKEDLTFLSPLLKTFPKCYWIWNHRAWLLQQASRHSPPATARQLWQGELALVGKMLGYDSRNFHGWGYRRTVVRALEETAQKEVEEQECENKAGEVGTKGHSMTEEEFAYTTKMIKTNLSNFSAWHNRSQSIPKLLDEKSSDGAARRKMSDDEFELITQALYTDPYDQSLWFYHQHLLTTSSPKVPSKFAYVSDLTNEDRMRYSDQEIDSVKDMSDATDDCKWIYQALLTSAIQYSEIDAGNKRFSTLEMRSWLDELEKSDPLRKGRWDDWRKSLNL